MVPPAEGSTPCTSIPDKRILGYPDRLSARPGEIIALHVSSPNGKFDLRFMRYKGSPEISPEARDPVLAPGIEGPYVGAEQVSHAGSFIRVDDLPEIRDLRFSIDFYPTLLDEINRGIVSWSSDLMTASLTTSVSGLTFRIQDHSLTLDILLETRAWHHLDVNYDYRTGQTTLRISTKSLNGQEEAFEEGYLDAGTTFAGSLYFGAVEPGAAHLNGKLANPRLHSGYKEVSQWNFGGDHGSDRVTDLVGGHTGMVFNAPVRASHGPSWDGTEVDPRLAEDMFNAIHFHEDSVSDVCWDSPVAFTVPLSWRSGIYAAVLDDGQSHDEVPFYVKAALGAEAPLLFLAPTNTYIAYGNERMPFGAESDALNAMKDKPVVANDDDHWLNKHPELGMSIYDTHRDGAGCIYSSRLRPLLSFRAHYRSWITDTQRHFAADLYLIDFLERHGIEYSVAVDEDLHIDGLALLKPYRALVTGSHPEYHTHKMLDALRDYLMTGGRMAYLGANGFYWVTSYLRGGTHTIETRRGFTGDTTYYSVPGETHHSSTGEPGGIWRLRGRDPRKLVGIAFASKGWSRAKPYYQVEHPIPGWEWVFDGVPHGSPIGDQGKVLDGAAGDELDCVDPKFGTPDAAVVLAVARDFDDQYQPCIEDYTTIMPNVGGTVNARVRADMVGMETGMNGAVFGVGSICWIAALPINGFDNAVAKVTANVLRRFISDESVVEK